MNTQEQAHTGSVVSNGGAAIERRVERETISGTYQDPRVLDAKLTQASNRAHLVSPFTSVGALPAGFAVRLAAVMVDRKNETYPIPASSKVGLAKAALDKIGHALGLSWDPRMSGRLDDGRDPRYCRYRAVGSYMGADGIRHVVSAEKEMDLREGSPTVEGLAERAAKKGKKADDQIRELRMHIVSHAETKARLRAIRSMGIRTAYEPDELTKPFVAACVTFTGATDDPALRAEFAKLIAQNALAGTAMLYPPAPGPALLERTPAPPIESSVPDLDDEDDDESDLGPDDRAHDDVEVY